MSQTAAATAEAKTQPETQESGERVYFPELDGMRFVAFLFVYLFHQGVPWPLLASWVGVTVTHRLQENGGYGVQLFFILSGYLITTLLLREEARYGRIALRAFWIRRILRIWPLYYLIVVIGFFVLPPFEPDIHDHRVISRTLKIAFLAVSAFLCGNWSMVLFRPIASDSLSVLWSVCVEEQFYLIVPLFIALVVPRFRRLLVGLLLVGSIVVRWLCASLSGSPVLIVYNTFAQFDTLCAGVLLALCMGWNRDRPCSGPRAPLAAMAVVCRDRLALQPQERRGRQRLASHRGTLSGSGCAASVSSSVAVWGNGWLQAALSYSRIVWLGKISYGLYMYHEIAIWVRKHVMSRTGWFPNQDEILTIATFALVIAMAAISYYGYERRFLLLKRAWTRVPSRPV